MNVAMRVGAALGLVGLVAPGPARAQDGAWAAERRDIRIPMRDGKALAADLYLPGKPGKYPVVLVQTPYGKGGLARAILAGEDEGNEVSRGTVSDMARIRDRDRTGTCVVDWRGFHGSRDAGTAGPGRRGLDGYDCVEWLAAQEFCDGRVGTWGGSALGRQQFETAATHPPHLVCCVPLIAPLGQVYEGYYEGEVLLESHVRTLDLLGFGVSRTVRAFPRPDAPAWRLARSRTYRPEAIEVPCLLITGWWDQYPDQILQTFEDLLARSGAKTRTHSRLLVGPWDHVSVGAARQGDLQFPGAAGASGAVAKAFLDRFLLGEENGWEQAPRVRYWQAGEGWRSAESWSGVARETRLLRLRPDGAIAPGDPVPGSRTLRGDPSRPAPTLGGANLPPVPHGPRDQSPLGKRDDVLSWETPPLDAPLRLNGNAELA
ncbi:MAG: CocE/NonD family hydrolase, partial [Planctomycetales bacterium]|nr:CocE/NonD family hydrolase [Planctomycetales bacterium]